MEKDVTSRITVAVTLVNRHTNEEVKDEFWPDGSLSMLVKEIPEIAKEEYGDDWVLKKWERVVE